MLKTFFNIVRNWLLTFYGFLLFEAMWVFFFGFIEPFLLNSDTASLMIGILMIPIGLSIMLVAMLAYTTKIINSR